MVRLAPVEISKNSSGEGSNPGPGSLSPVLSLTPDHEEQFDEIGQTLRVCEACYSSVGIPWLPPTREIRRLRKLCSQSLDEFVRCSLVTVSTKHLESYLHDLEMLPDDLASSEKLYISLDSRIDRFSFAVIFSTLSTIAAFLVGISFNLGESTSINIAALACAVLTVLSLSLCSESCRRASFHRIISDELMRRKGLNTPSLTKLPLYTLGW